MHSHTFDVVIIGTGIVGLTVAYEILQRQPSSKIALLDKESDVAKHASGRNSGVMHCGIYYASDTLKAQVCAKGAQRMRLFAEAEAIAYRACGKVILATSEQQLPVVDKLLTNAQQNHIPAERIDNQQLRELEPYAATELAAIYCPTTAVIDSLAVVTRLRDKLLAQGVKFFFNTRVVGAQQSQSIQTTDGTFSYGFLVNCAGAYADTIAKYFGLAEDYALVPFKGIYWKLTADAAPKVRANIYPVPDISLPFLGVHLTRVINNDVYIGPTAIPAFGRENYQLTEGLSVGESLDISWQLLKMYARNANNFRKLAHLEIAKYRKENFLQAARKLMPSLTGDDMVAS
ncbi:L-2-hydroxyglutarate oxidase, partial [Methylocucumis oryzae]|uniref:L-2-hydroxyglutarate oxidase n=1 Tax=Methylocucumis oryzae TaxID=1632867 RepID=UPI0005F35F33